MTFTSIGFSESGIAAPSQPEISVDYILRLAATMIRLALLLIAVNWSAVGAISSPEKGPTNYFLIGTPGRFHLKGGPVSRQIFRPPLPDFELA
ncbi:MAG: hypothetical protein ACREC1_08125 [Methylovirgula sp.]